MEQFSHYQKHGHARRLKCALSMTVKSVVVRGVCMRHRSSRSHPLDKIFVVAVSEWVWHTWEYIPKLEIDYCDAIHVAPARVLTEISSAATSRPLVTK